MCWIKTLFYDLGQMRLINGVGRGCNTLDWRRPDTSDVLSSSCQQNVSVPSQFISQAVSNAETAQRERVSVKPEPAKPRLATATAAFSLSGIGRGQAVIPPSQYYSL